uniref:Jerky-like n=1 Tax=Schizaphis graminum TaxID=13262 RepID=A0A2S2NP39_SCHGA
MPRTRKRITNRGTMADSEMRKAADICLQENQSIRSVAASFNICHVSLSRYIKKLKLHQNGRGDKPVFGYRAHNKVFNQFQENQLSEYIKNSADMYFGLSPTAIRKLAFDFSLKLNLKVPKNWTDNEHAGIDWFTAFLKRNPTLSIRQPEATSISRAMNFNPANIKLFMDKYESVLLKYKFEAQHIYNLDETGITTVQNTEKVVALKGKKQIGAITSGERGTLVTMCLAVNATGNFIPPMFIFPRVNYKDFFIRGGPTGCIGAANKSGWMQGEEFLIFMKHFANYVRPSVDRKILVLLDNHESHLFLPVIDFCREVGIVLLSFPPHCSHKIQPLDRSVYGPFKKCVNQNMTAWMHNNPGKRITIYDIPHISSGAIISAATPKNILKGFSVSGIWPFNRDAFSEDEYAPSTVTDIMIDIQTQTSSELVKNVETTPTIQPEKIILNDVDQQPSKILITPEHIKPYPKVQFQEKALKKRGRKKGKTAILTDTPEKIELENKVTNTAKRSLQFKENKKKSRKIKKLKTVPKKNKKKIVDSEEEDETFCLVCGDTYSNSKNKETWIQCLKCKFWAHENCTDLTKMTAFYKCDNCEADEVGA